MLSFQQAKTFLAPTEFQKIMVQFWFSRVYLGTALFTVIGCFTDGKNEHGLKLEKLGQVLMPAKITKNLRDGIYVYSRYNSRRAFCVWVRN